MAQLFAAIEMEITEQKLHHPYQHIITNEDRLRYVFFCLSDLLVRNVDTGHHELS